MAGPEPPPCNNVSRVSILKSPLSRPRPWQLTQRASRMGLISLLKSTACGAAGGKAFICSGVNAAETVLRPAHSQTKIHRDILLTINLKDNSAVAKSAITRWHKRKRAGRQRLEQ